MSDPVTEAPVLQITKASTWQAVRLPLRLRIFETARRLGEASVTELALAVGLNRTALYFHLRQLEKAGLLVSRSGAPTPGRRGKRPRYYRATAQELTFPLDKDAKRDTQKACDFWRPWLTESRGVVLDPKSPGGTSAKRVLMSWENLTDDEAGRVRSMANELEDIVRRARNRANMMRKAPCANYHVGMIMVPLEGQTMPGPEIKFKSK